MHCQQSSLCTDEVLSPCSLLGSNKIELKPVVQRLVRTRVPVLRRVHCSSQFEEHHGRAALRLVLVLEQTHRIRHHTSFGLSTNEQLPGIAGNQNNLVYRTIRG